MSRPEHPFDDGIRHLAKKRGWTLDKYVLFVEGGHDERYLRLAARLFEREHAFLLLDEIAVNVFDGTKSDAFEHVRHLISTNFRSGDRDRDRLCRRMMVLLDDDVAGREALDDLEQSGREFVVWHSLFPLRHRMRRGKRDLAKIEEQMTADNASLGGLDCEIEDLLCPDLIPLLIGEELGWIRNEIERDGCTHFELRTEAKSKLCKEVEKNATLADVAKLCELLRFIRYQLDLDIDPDP